MKKLGEKLKKVRIKKNLSLEDISSRSRITLRCLKAIEEGEAAYFHDDFSMLLYYIRQYGKTLDVPEAEIEKEIRRIRADVGALSDGELFERKEEEEQKNEGGFRLDLRFLSLLFSIVLLIVLIGFVLIRYVLPNFRIIDPPSDLQPTPQEEVTEEYEISDAVVQVEQEGQKKYNILGWEKEKAVTIRIEIGAEETYVGHAIVNGEEITSPENRIYDPHSSLSFHYLPKAADELVIHLGKVADNRIYINNVEITLEEEVRASSNGIHLTLIFQE